MTIFYKNVLVCGYDKFGELCFQERLYGNESSLAETLLNAYAHNCVIKVQIELNESNVTIYDTDEKEVKK